MSDQRLPVLALVGRPNVGKSTLFNRLTGTRDALVADFAGLTRDRQYGFAAREGQRYIVVDTGGLSPESGDALAALAERQAHVALAEADRVLFMTDARAGATGADRRLASELRKLGKPVLLVVNKVDGAGLEAPGEFFELGLGAPLAIAAEHNLGIERLLDAALAGLPVVPPEPDDAPGTVRVAVVGRPNVGKSTLINRLLGEDRVLAGDTPGTTRDSIAVPFEYDGRPFVLVDTAGIRRKSKITETVEKFSIVKTLQAIERAHVVVSVVDGAGDIGEQDARLMGLVAQRGRGMVLACNKWDGLGPARREDVRSEIDLKLPFLDHVPLHFISAKHGSGLRELMLDVIAVHVAATRELPTPELNRVLQKALDRHQPPAVVGRRIKLRYAHQGGRNPPVIVFHGNQTQRLPGTYKRFLANEFRDAFDLKGVPLRLEFRNGENPYAPKGKGRDADKYRDKDRDDDRGKERDRDG